MSERLCKPSAGRLLGGPETEWARRRRRVPWWQGAVVCKGLAKAMNVSARSTGQRSPGRGGLSSPNMSRLLHREVSCLDRAWPSTSLARAGFSPLFFTIHMSPHVPARTLGPPESLRARKI